MTNGETIILPDIPDELNKKLKDPLLAGLLHESQHVVHSEFNKSKIGFKELAPFSGLLNNIEDIRIYQLGKKEYPGYQDLQETGLSFIKDNIIIPSLASEEGVDMPTLLGGCLQYRLSGIDDSFFPEAVRKMAEIAEEECNSDTKWIPREKGKYQSAEITRRIINRLKDQLEKEQKKKEEGKAEGKPEGKKEQQEEEPEETEEQEKSEQEQEEKGNQGEPAEGKEETEDENEENEEETEEEMGEGEGEGEDEEDKDDSENSDNENGKSSNKESQDEKEDVSHKGDPELESSLEEFFNEEDREESDEDKSLMKQMESMISEIIRKFNVENENHVPYPDIVLLDKEVHIQNYNPYKTGDKGNIIDLESEFMEISNSIDRQTQILKAKILPVLMAEQRSSFLFEQEEGILDSARIFRIPNGDPKVYKRKVPGKKTNTAISILCDISGSMHGSRIRMLKPTLLVIADTLFALKISFEILAFGTGDDYEDSKVRAKQQKIYKVWRDRTKGAEFYNRFTALHHLIVKSFEENYLKIRDLIPLIECVAANADGESVEWALKRLSSQREPRKILFVLSDGMPAAGTCDSWLLEKHLKEVVKKAERAGIEIIGVGIETSAPRKFYPTTVTINDVSEISSEIYGSLLQKLKN